MAGDCPASLRNFLLPAFVLDPRALAHCFQFKFDMAIDNKYDRQLRLWGTAGQVRVGVVCSTYWCWVASHSCGTALPGTCYRKL